MSDKKNISAVLFIATMFIALCLTAVNAWITLAMLLSYASGIVSCYFKVGEKVTVVEKLVEVEVPVKSTTKKTKSSTK